MNVRAYAVIVAGSVIAVCAGFGAPARAEQPRPGLTAAAAPAASADRLSESADPGPAEACHGAAFEQAAASGVAAPRGIVVFPIADETSLREQGIEIWDRDQDIVVGGAGERELAAVAAKGLQPIVKLADQGEFLTLLSHEPGYAGPSIPGIEPHHLTATSDLYLVVPDLSFQFPRVRPLAGFRGIPRIALPPLETAPADLEAEPDTSLAVNPYVTQIVNATSQANWFQDVKDLSGENTVVIGGQTRTILTRWSNAMYPTPTANAYASEYLLEKAAGWGYTGQRETYTSVQSGCSGQGSTVWQNLVFTIPGQIDTEQHTQVLFVTHHDSLSFNNTENATYAPGADDAISGGSALIEALRLFKDYGFKNTIKIIFFSGEEQGLCGSTAYTRQPQHTMADIKGVVNMDQTAYDGDKNGVMNCYNWDAAHPTSQALGDSFVLANQDYGPIINPVKISRATNMMCQTDHCPFWQVGVPAIAICEDLAHNEICPCFDQSQTSTCHDTVTQMDPNHPAQLMFDPNYSWPTEKAAIATVAHLAEPLYPCPPSAPTLTATPASHVVHLSWPATGSVTNYVIERGASCAGPFSTLVSATGTTYDDTGLTDGQTYAYRMRTCPNQMSACVAVVPNGPSVVVQPGSPTIVADSGDHDGLADNCELSTVQFNMLNNGSVPLTGVKISSITSTYPGVQVATAVQQTLGNLGLAQTAPVTFKFYLGRNGSSANCGQSLTFNVVASSDQAPSSPSSFVLTVERNAVANPTYNFDTDFSGWSVTSGTLSRIAGGAPGSTPFSVHTQNANNVCAAIQSPTVVPSATSTMTMWVNYGIDGTVSDRAVVRAINQITLAKTLLVPTGAVYTTTAPAGSSLNCDGIESLQGWAGNAPTWQQATFDLSPFAGTPTKIEVRYATDNAGVGSQGFWFDAVQITNPQSCDTQTNTCSPLPPEVSPDGGPVAFTIDKNGSSYDLRFSEVTGATKYNVYGGSIQILRSNTYDHAAGGGVCSLTDATTGDGQVIASVPASTFADNSYILVAAQNTAGESVYGHRTGGASIPLALSSCP